MKPKNIAKLFLSALVLMGLFFCGCGRPGLSKKTDATKFDSSAENKVQETRTVAKVGVGKKGRKPAGMIRVSTNAYFAAKEMIAFDIQIPKNMQLYKALNGRAPKSHKEFQEKIIIEGKVKLPELPEGSYYEYDPKTEQLMVIKPGE